MFQKDILFLAGVVNGSAREMRAGLELSELTPSFRPLAQRLIAVPADECEPIWEDFLTGRRQSEPVGTTVAGTAESGVSAAESAGAPSPAQAAPGPAVPVESRRRVRLTRAIDVGSSWVDWLWAGRVPLGMITMLAGDPKLGKSYVTLAMAAAVSRGLPLPMSDRPDRPGSVILMSAEDSPARTIVPRLIAAGADLTKVHILESVILANGSETLPSLQADIDAITTAATRLGDCRLIVIDPVSAYLNGVDDHRNAALRGVLAPLNGLAERLGAAVVLVSHLNKGGSANGKHRILGSIAYVGTCRANHLFVADPHDPTGRRVLLLDNGGNVAPPAPTLAYTITDGTNGARIEWSLGPLALTVNDVLKTDAAAVHQRAQADERCECDDWLRTLLTDGTRATIDVFKAGAGAGFTKDQIRRAKFRIGAVARKEGFGGTGLWSWRLDVHP
jgi:putative DNA primase/helicase